MFRTKKGTSRNWRYKASDHIYDHLHSAYNLNNHLYSQHLQHYQQSSRRLYNLVYHSILIITIIRIFGTITSWSSPPPVFPKSHHVYHLHHEYIWCWRRIFNTIEVIIMFSILLSFLISHWTRSNMRYTWLQRMCNKLPRSHSIFRFQFIPVQNNGLCNKIWR